MNNDRRQHPRYIPDSALLVSLGQSKRGFLKDVSESGMAFDGLLPNPGNNVIYLAFDLPDGGGAIEAVAEIVWTCEALHRTGVRFLELAEASRRQLRDWISSHVFALSEKASEEEEYEAQHSAANRPAEFRAIASPQMPHLNPDSLPDATLPEHIPAAKAPRRQRKKLLHRIRSPKRTIRLPRVPASIGAVLAVLFLSTACVSLGYYLPGMILGRAPMRGLTPAPAPVAAPLAASPVAAAPTAAFASNAAGASVVAANNVAVDHDAANRSLVTKAPVTEAPTEVREIANKAPAVSTPSATSGFILQVAAMTQAVNAAKLIEKLRRKNFPAFLPDRGKDTLFRVQVGPYEDIDYARTVAGDLKSAGFPVILRHRSGQQDSN